MDDSTGAVLEEIGTTYNHPFWVEETASWVPAGRLVPGWHLQSPSTGAVRVRAVEQTSLREEVFNLEVASSHSYLVGESGVLVHNCKRTANQAAEGGADVVTANGQRAARDGTPIGPSGKKVFHNSNSPTRKAAVDGAKSQGSGRVVVDNANAKQSKHLHAVDQKGQRVTGPRKTHFNKRGDKPRD